MTTIISALPSSPAPISYHPPSQHHIDIRSPSSASAPAMNPAEPLPYEIVTYGAHPLQHIAVYNPAAQVPLPVDPAPWVMCVFPAPRNPQKMVLMGGIVLSMAAHGGTRK